MNLRDYILIFTAGTLIATAAWIMVLFNIDPVTAGVPALVVFYATLFIALSGFFTTSATALRTVLFPKRHMESVVYVSLRQGVFFASLVVGTMLLLSADLLSWWTMILLVAFLALVEFVFVSTGKRG